MKKETLAKILTYLGAIPFIILTSIFLLLFLITINLLTGANGVDFSDIGKFLNSNLNKSSFS